MAVGTTTALLIGGGIGLGAFGAKKSGFFGGAAKAAQQVMQLPQPPSASDAGAKADEIIKKKRASMSQSIYTSPLGVSGEADVARKTLLGQ